MRCTYHLAMMACTTLLVIFSATSGFSVPIAESHSLILRSSSFVPRRPGWGCGYVLKSRFLILPHQLWKGLNLGMNSPKRDETIKCSVSEPSRSLGSMPKMPDHHIISISWPFFILRVRLFLALLETGSRSVTLQRRPDRSSV